MSAGSWYREGTINVVSGSPNIVGVNTLWLSQLKVGQILWGPDNKLYEITAISTDTAAAIRTWDGVAAYQGTTANGQAYAVIRGQSGTTNAQLAADIANILQKYNLHVDQNAAWVGGTASGGPNSDGAYPLTNDAGVTALVKCPARLAADVAGFITTHTRYFGTVTLNGNAGVTVTHNKGDLNYAVKVTPLGGAQALSRVGEITLGTRANNTVVIHNSGEPRLTAQVEITATA